MNDFNELEAFLHEKLNHMLDADVSNHEKVHRIRSQEHTSELDSVLIRGRSHRVTWKMFFLSGGVFDFQKKTSILS